MNITLADTQPKLPKLSVSQSIRQFAEDAKNWSPKDKKRFVEDLVKSSQELRADIRL